MRSITIWLTTIMTVLAMGYYYNLSRSGDGKVDDRGSTSAACATPQTGAGQAAERATPVASDGQPDPCAQPQHTGKPGESK